jgi:hypothetical protein
MKTFAICMLAGIAYSSQYNSKCTGAIDRILDGMSKEQAIARSQQSAPYSDASFPAASEMLFWPNFKSNRLSTYPNEFTRLGTKYPNSKLFGNDNIPDPHGVRQGYIGNCYIKAAFSSLAENAEKFKSYWNTKSRNAAGIYSANWFIAGK